MTTDPTGWLARAMAAFEARDRDSAADAVRRLIDARPSIGPTWAAVGRMAVVLGEIDSAVQASRLFADSTPDPLARLQLAERLAHCGRHHEAIETAESMQRSQPDLAAAWHMTGVCRIETGQTEAGVADLRRALALSTAPLALAWSWQTLSGAKRFVADDDPDLKAMQDFLKTLGPADQEARGVLLTALGKAFDDLDDVANAFPAYAEAAALADQAHPRELANDEALADSVIAGFDQGLLKRLSSQGVETDRPIFVLGMPRSGTTLVEQILVSHPDVSAGAEVGLIQAAAMPVGGISPEAIQRFAQADPTALRRVAAAYLGLLDQRFGTDGKVVDKTLQTTRFIGLVHVLLPHARFIWLRRDPGAVAWSCFRTRFTRGLVWTNAFESIARWMKTEDRLHAHWSDVLADAVLTVPYDELVSNPATWTPVIARHVGLPPAEGMLQPHLTRRAIPSASHSQVRQPIHTGSVDAWRRYERQLEPFFDAYNRP